MDAQIRLPRIVDGQEFTGLRDIARTHGGQGRRQPTVAPDVPEGDSRLLDLAFRDFVNALLKELQ
ncbi:hypothetical protein [Nocardiopsis dassonvillei]|uniref:hypothetical protein n=1 Tax=Nocardiopsis dassonvillei TaxID=2014 RepID=UPI003F57E59F